MDFNSQTFKDKEEKSTYRNRLKEINLSLSLNQFSEIPDLQLDNSYGMLNKTLKIIAQVLEDRHKVIEQKTEIAQKIARLEADQQCSGDRTEGLNHKLKELTSKVEFYKNKFSLQEKKTEKELEKLSKEKDEVQKSFVKISMKESQYKHEIKKLEGVVEELKGRLKKYMNDNKEIKIVDNKNERILVNNNNIVFDNFLKNSPSIIFNQVNYSKDFYALIHKSFNEKIKIVTQENKDLRECIKFLRDEMLQYIDFKKTVMYELAKDSFTKDITELKDCSNLINMDIFNLDFSTAKNEILQLFNEVIDNFRFLLIYDIYKVNPETEFNFDEVRRSFKNNKFNVTNLPYYSAIQSSVEKLNLNKLEELKKEIEDKLKKEVKSNRKRSDQDGGFSSSTPPLEINYNQEGDDKVLAQIDELDTCLEENINRIDELFREAEDDFRKELTKMIEAPLEG